MFKILNKLVKYVFFLQFLVKIEISFFLKL